jgi:hypothetical protein
VSIPGTVLIYAINRTDAWWRHIGDNMGFERAVVVTDIRGAGELCVVDEFYEEYGRQRRGAPGSAYLSPEEVDDVVARCRVLRCLPKEQARAMACAMAWAFNNVLEKTTPRVIVSFPIDRYVSDVLERLAHKRGIPHLELTASLVSGMCMLLYRGQLVKSGSEPAADIIEHHRHEIADPLFKPSYVKSATSFTLWRFLRVFFYFRLRAIAFWLISLAKRDPLNLHYVDSQSFLGHKPRLADARVLSLQDRDWRRKLEAFPRERRIFFGLQLFPEASIDYWIKKIELIDYEDVLVETAQAFSAAGYQILVKDHPLQFGFRQRGLIERLLAVPNVLFAPYEVSANEILGLVAANHTFTGTLGLQAALLGLVSVATPTYYVTPGAFVTFDGRDKVAGLPECVRRAVPPVSLEARQRAIIKNLLEGSFPGDFFSFRGFDAKNPNPRARELADAFGRQVESCIASGRPLG